MLNNTQKKVLFLITKANWGGAQRYVYDLATNLDKSQFVSLVVSGETGALTDALKHQQIDHLTLPGLNNSLSPKEIFAASKALYQLFRNEKPDIIHVNSSVAGGLGAFVGRLARVPKIIFTAHGWAFNEERSFLARQCFRLLHYATVLLTHRTIAVSAAIVKQLNLPGVSKKMKVLHPGRTIGFMFDRTDARATLIQDLPYLESFKDNIWIGTIAELHPIKQHDVLIKSFIDIRAKYPTARLLIIGAGSEQAKLGKLIQVYGLDDQVFLLGAIHEAARLLKAFDIFALASHSEAYGYVLHEAGLAGLPTVATNVGGIPEVIENGVTGLLVPEKDPAAFSRAFDQLLSDSALASRLALAHHDRMTERSLDKMVKATEALYTL
jgi:glycosyltransferase involved in cell wall biosynthesis